MHFVYLGGSTDYSVDAACCCLQGLDLVMVQILPSLEVILEEAKEQSPFETYGVQKRDCFEEQTIEEVLRSLQLERRLEMTGMEALQKRE